MTYNSGNNGCLMFSGKYKSSSIDMGILELVIAGSLSDSYDI